DARQQLGERAVKHLERRAGDRRRFGEALESILEDVVGPGAHAVGVERHPQQLLSPLQQLFSTTTSGRLALEASFYGPHRTRHVLSPRHPDYFGWLCSGGGLTAWNVPAGTPIAATSHLKQRRCSGDTAFECATTVPHVKTGERPPR